MQVEGALSEGSPDQRSVRVCSSGKQQQQGLENAAAVAGTGSTGCAVAAAMATAETARPTMPTAPSSIADNFDSDSDSTQSTTAIAEGNAAGIDSKSRLGQTTTAPVPATKDDAGDLPSATTAMDVDFDSDLSPAQLTGVAASGTAAITYYFDPDFPVQTAVVTATSTAADVDFDSGSSPAKPPVVVATGTAADVDFDSDSSAATPVPATVADAVGVNFVSDSQPPAGAKGAADNGGVEELLRLASEVEEEGERGTSSITSCPASRSSVHVPGPKPIQQVGQAEPNSGEAVAASARKRRRCGTVYLGGTASDCGFCPSSLSQRACDKLRCTDCNFEVLRFYAKAWDESAIDYMFLRNNAPDPVKLSARLLDCPGACAFACQCSWQTVKELRVLLPTERPRWACGGHN